MRRAPSLEFLLRPWTDPATPHPLSYDSVAACSAWRPPAKASLLIRKLDDTLHVRLKARAQQHGRSLAEAVRETLRLALARDASTQEPPSLMRIAAGVFGPDRGIELELPARSPNPDRPLPDLGGPGYEP